MLLMLLRTTAATMIAPVIIVCTLLSTPRMFIALEMTPISRQPRNAPLIVPLPPSKVTPPIMAAARAFVS